MTPGLK